MLRNFMLAGVCIACLLECGAAAGDAQESIYSKSEVFYEGLIEVGRQSTVYSFNFNNLIIIVIMKVLILLLVGGLGAGAVGRSYEEEPALDADDVLFMLTYLVSDGIEQYDCLNLLSCLDDKKAQDLLFGSRLMLKGARLLQSFHEYDLGRYEWITYGMQDAIDHRRSGGSCHQRYSCYSLPSL